MIRLLAVDMDGTCLDQKSRMTDAVLSALREAAARGVIVVPTTGRNLECIPHRLAAGTLRKTGTHDDAANRELFRYVITSNGAKLTDIRGQKTLFEAPISPEESVSLLRSCRKIRLGTASHIRHKYLLQGRALATAGLVLYGKDARGICCVRDMEAFIRNHHCNVEEFQFYFLSPGARQNVYDVLERYPGLQAASTGIYAEIYSGRASKGRALAELAGHLGIEKEEIACIGDGENDLSMFQAAGLKIAMGNAVNMLKERADHIVESNRRDGAARAVERYIL